MNIKKIGINKKNSITVIRITINIMFWNLLFLNNYPYIYGQLFKNTYMYRLSLFDYYMLFVIVN